MKVDFKKKRVKILLSLFLIIVTIISFKTFGGADFIVLISPSDVSVNLADESITESKIKDGAVTAIKLSDMSADNGDIIMFSSVLNSGTGGWYTVPGFSPGVSSITTGAGLVGGTITTSGTISVDIGTTAGKIPILDGSADLNLSNDLYLGSSGKVIFPYTAGPQSFSLYSDGSFHFYDETNTASRMSISSTGDVAIGGNLTVQGKLVCLADGTNCSPTGVSQIIAGSGLSGGTITSTGTISIATGGVGTSHIASKAVTLDKVQDVTAGFIIVGDVSNRPTAVAISGDVSMSNTGVITIEDSAVTTSKILDTAVTLAKIQDVTSGYFILGDGTNRPELVQMSGDATLSNSGVFNIASGVIVNADISSSAAIDATKIYDGTIDNTEFSYLDGVTSNIQTQFNNLTTVPAEIVVHEYTDVTADILTFMQTDVTADYSLYFPAFMYGHVTASTVMDTTTDETRIIITKYINRNHTPTVADDTYGYITLEANFKLQFTSGMDSWGQTSPGWLLYDFQTIFTAIGIPNANLSAVVGEIRRVSTLGSPSFDSGRLSQSPIRSIKYGGRYTKVAVISGYAAPDLFASGACYLEVHIIADIRTTDAVI